MATGPSGLNAASWRPHACRENRAMCPCYVNIFGRKIGQGGPRVVTKQKSGIWLRLLADWFPWRVRVVRWWWLLCVASFIRRSMMWNKFAWGGIGCLSEVLKLSCQLQWCGTWPATDSEMYLLISLSVLPLYICMYVCFQFYLLAKVAIRFFNANMRTAIDLAGVWTFRN